MSEIQIGSGEELSRTAPPLDHALLDLFRMPPTEHPVEGVAAASRALWTADALHRANNLAQMSSSLESNRVRHHHGLHTGEAAACARALSRAYAELGENSGVDEKVPCVPLLEAVVTRLTSLFKGSRAVDLQLALDDIKLPAEQRRALVLIASELVINALKYAFPAGRGGLIIVSLVRLSEAIEMSIADDGVGLVSSSSGSGKALMGRFAALLSADLRYVSTKAGLKVTVSMPCYSN